MKEKQAKKQKNDGVLPPPANFSAVDDGINRSALPQPSNFPFLKTLNLKSILYLCPEPYPEENKKFLEDNNIELHQFGMNDKKDTSVHKDTIVEALKVLIDSRNHPTLIHCAVGKHRTGAVVACLRKVQNWSLGSVVEEYKRFAGSYARETDMKFIEKFKVMRVSLLPDEDEELIYVLGSRGEQELCRCKIGDDEYHRDIRSFSI